MEIYHYDKNTGKFLGSSEARLDPLELEINKKEIYMLPAHATFEAPPTNVAEDKMVVRANGKWVSTDIPKPEPIPEPIPPTKEELEMQAKEVLIQAKMRELAITALMVEGKLTEAGKLV